MTCTLYIANQPIFSLTGQKVIYVTIYRLLGYEHILFRFYANLKS